MKEPPKSQADPLQLSQASHVQLDQHQLILRILKTSAPHIHILNLPQRTAPEAGLPLSLLPFHGASFQRG